MVEKTHTAAGHESGFWPHVMEPLRQAGARIADFFAPSADAAATEDCYEINVELPGVAAEDVSVQLDGNVLSVHGEKRTEREETGRSYYFSERRFGTFHRSFRLPEDIKTDSIKADFENGVLTLRVGKQDQSRSNRIKVPVNQR